MSSYQGVLHRYQGLLDLPAHTRTVTLMEGNTPLIPAQRLAKQLGGGFELFIKFEGLNPTGSFKDRGMTAAVSEAYGRDAKAVICASTGNTAASAAAYAARAGMRSVVLIPQGKVAAGKLAGALAYGAQVIQVEGSFDDALSMVVQITQKQPICLVNSLNPYRIEGQKSAAFEICDTLGRAPDVHFLPVGNAGNITAYWKGYREYFADGIVSSLPRMFGFQAAGAAPLVLGHPVLHPDTIATAIRIGAPASWAGAVDARDSSHGLIDAVTDQQILQAYRLLATTEGVFVEPASAASVAGLLATAADGRLPAGSLVVCTVTGNGLKDPDTAMTFMTAPEVLPVASQAVAQALGLT